MGERRASEGVLSDLNVSQAFVLPKKRRQKFKVHKLQTLMDTKHSALLGKVFVIELLWLICYRARLSSPEKAFVVLLNAVRLLTGITLFSLDPREPYRIRERLLNVDIIYSGKFNPLRV